MSPAFGNTINIDIDEQGIASMQAGQAVTLPDGDYCFDYIPDGSARGGACNWVVTVDGSFGDLTPQELLDMATPAATYRASMTSLRSMLAECESNLAAMADEVLDLAECQTQLTAAQAAIEFYAERYGTVDEAEFMATVREIRSEGGLRTVRYERDCASCPQPPTLQQAVRGAGLSTRSTAKIRKAGAASGVSRISESTNRSASSHSQGSGNAAAINPLLSLMAGARSPMVPEKRAVTSSNCTSASSSTSTEETTADVIGTPLVSTGSGTSSDPTEPTCVPCNI